MEIKNLLDVDNFDDTFWGILPPESSQAGKKVVWCISSRGQWIASACVTTAEDCSQINPFSDANDFAEEGIDAVPLKAIRNEGWSYEDAALIFEVAPGEYFIDAYEPDSGESVDVILFGTEEEANDYADETLNRFFGGSGEASAFESFLKDLGCTFIKNRKQYIVSSNNVKEDWNKINDYIFDNYADEAEAYNYDVAKGIIKVMWY